MKKELLLLNAIFISGIFYAQVGINTASPQATFHIDGGKDNPTDNTIPTVAQQRDDFVVTSNGNVGIATIVPTEKLEVNGKAKINNLHVNGTTGFTATRTLVADANGVIGVLNGLPPSSYGGYSMTSLKVFNENNATTRSYSYKKLVGSCTARHHKCPVPASTVFRENYQFTFDKSSTHTDKYIQMNIDYKVFFYAKREFVFPEAVYYNYNIEVTINDISIKRFETSETIPAEGSNIKRNTKSITADISGIPLNPTNNVVKVYYRMDRYNTFKGNAGTSNGNFETTAPRLLDLSIVDLSFQLYEK